MVRSRRGGASVFLMMAFVSILLVIAVLTEAVSSYAARSYAMSVIELAGRSTLSNYNRNLKEDYGLFGVLMSDDEIQEEVLYYCEESITSKGKKDDTMQLMNLQMKNFRVESDEYVLTNGEIFEKQVIDYMKYRVLGDILADWSGREAEEVLSEKQNAVSGLLEKTEELEKATELMDKIKPVLTQYEDALDETKKLEKTYERWEELKMSDSENAAEAAAKLEERLNREWTRIKKTFQSIGRQADEIQEEYEKGNGFGESGKNMMQQLNQIQEKIKYFLSVSVGNLGDVFQSLEEEDGKGKRYPFWKRIKEALFSGSKNDNEKGRELKNQTVIEYLPSHQIEESGWEFKGLQAFLQKKDFLTEAKNKFLLNQYILAMFHTQLTENERETFFENEVEYLLFGGFKDVENKKKAEASIFAVRSASNLVYLYSNPGKQRELVKAAAALTPGPEAIITQFVLASLWSCAEAKNDLNILLDSGSVPFLKDDDSWALSLDSVLSGKSSNGKVKDKSTGLKYEQYLELFLFCSSKQIILVRMMDLIQINLQERCNKDFLLSNCKGGFVLNGEIWKKKLLGRKEAGKLIRKGKVVVRHAY